MRLGTGFTTSNRYTPYPFDEEGFGEVVPADFVLDAFIETDPAVERVYLAGITAGDYTLSFRLEYSDGSAPDTVSGSVDRKTDIGEWEYDILVFEGTGRTVIKLTVSKTFHDELGELVTDADYGDSLPFSPGVMEYYIPRAESFRILESSTADPDPSEVLVSGIDGDVELKSGYNIDMEVVAPGTRFPDGEVGIAAVKGYGAGTVPCEERQDREDNLLSELVTPDAAGNINIESGDCISVYTNDARDKIILSNECIPLHDCSPYVTAAEDIKELMGYIGGVHTGIGSLSSNYSGMVGDWNNEAGGGLHINGAWRPSEDGRSVIVSLDIGNGFDIMQDVNVDISGAGTYYEIVRGGYRVGDNTSNKFEYVGGLTAGVANLGAGKAVSFAWVLKVKDGSILQPITASISSTSASDSYDWGIYSS